MTSDAWWKPCSAADKGTRFQREGKQYDVIVQIEDSLARGADRSDVEFVRNREGATDSLSHLVQVQETVAASSLNDFNRQRAAILEATRAGATLGQALEYLRPAATENHGRSETNRLRRSICEFKEVTAPWR